MTAASAVLVIVSCPRKSAAAIAETLVAESLAACVSILPTVVSTYRWKGDLCKDDESLLLIKTKGDNWSKLEARVKELHSYDVPEILMIPISGGHAPYLDWLTANASPLGLIASERTEN